MRILLIAALYPPNARGGAENSAANLAAWLAGQGHEVAVLTGARRDDEILDGEIVGGLRIWRLRTAHLYPAVEAPDAPLWQKPIWHLQDHFDPRNRRLVARVLDAFRPDFVGVHIIQGIGYAALAEIADRDLPTLVMLHDLGLACIRMSMFRSGENCRRQCVGCRLSARYKLSLIRRFRRVGFNSPSEANLAALAAFFPVSQYPHASIPNPNHYLPPMVARTGSDRVRLLYVGRLHRSKGVEILLDAAASLARSHRFQLAIVGGGVEEARLRARYPGAAWLRFHGQVSETEVADHMQNADLLCVPSVWRENWPGVVVRAQSLGLPVLGSRIGGIPELVEPGVTGDLAAPGDRRDWEAALGRILAEPERLTAWRRNAEATRDRFDQDALGQRMVAFMRAIAAAPKRL
ncbi:glycosyl transferase [Kaistia sp. 32K]|nr:glycosyl transferase [Kaistia sp. 32K]